MPQCILLTVLLPEVALADDREPKNLAACRSQAPFCMGLRGRGAIAAPSHAQGALAMSQEAP